MAATAAILAYRRDINAAATAFVSDVGALEVAVDRGDVPHARTNELAAQGEYDQFRMLESGNGPAASTLDGLATEVGPGQTLGGLHAVERDLWSSGDAARDITGLVAQAPVAQYLLARESLDPEAIGTTGVDELGWVNDTAVPGDEEQFSHLDAVDIAATVGGARDAFVSIEPLGHLVAPSLTTSLGAQFNRLLGAVRSLGPPASTPDQAISTAARRALAQQVDATAAGLARLSATLVPFGTAGPTS
jgi:iron uptake system component EfeO